MLYRSTDHECRDCPYVTWAKSKGLGDFCSLSELPTYDNRIPDSGNGIRSDCPLPVGVEVKFKGRAKPNIIDLSHTIEFDDEEDGDE